MKETITSKILWNQAGRAGCILALPSIAYTLLSGLLPGQGTSWAAGFALSALSLVLWAAKFVGCILLMRWFLQKLVEEFDGVDNATTLRYGTRIALLSALIVAAFSLANILFISPDAISAQLEASREMLAPYMDANSLAGWDSVQDSLPTIMFFTNLVYCFLYGYILSLILSRSIPPQDPFRTDRPSDLQ